jgi:ABC-type phosphate transport system ATPase subunit
LSDNLNVDYDYIYDTFVEDCKNIDLSRKIRELLNELKNYYHIVLVTDNMDSFTKFTVKNNLDYFNVFDSIFNSADE